MYLKKFKKFVFLNLGLKKKGEGLNKSLDFACMSHKPKLKPVPEHLRKRAGKLSNVQTEPFDGAPSPKNEGYEASGSALRSLDGLQSLNAHLTEVAREQGVFHASGSREIGKAKSSLEPLDQRTSENSGQRNGNRDSPEVALNGFALPGANFSATPSPGPGAACANSVINPDGTIRFRQDGPRPGQHQEEHAYDEDMDFGSTRIFHDGMSSNGSHEQKHPGEPEFIRQVIPAPLVAELFSQTPVCLYCLFTCHD